MASEAMLRAIVIAPKVTGGLSMIGSTFVCLDVLKDWRTKFKRVYHRLLFVMSCMDVFLSFTLFLSTWPIPKDSEPAPWLAAGNEATCTAQGFIQVFFTPALFYNAYLSIYYVLVIVYSWPEHKIVPLERGAHIFTFVFACVTAFTALALDLYGSNFLVWCFIAPGNWNVQLAMNVAWQWLAFFVVLVNMSFLSWKIGQQFRTTRKYGEAQVRESMQINEQQKRERNSKKSRGSWIRPSQRLVSWKRKSSVKQPNNPMASIKTQAALYALSFLLSESSNVALSIAYYKNENHYIPAWILLYAMLTLPLQGFWNCIIYFRPRFLKWLRDKHQKLRQSTYQTAMTTTKINDQSMAMDQHNQRFPVLEVYPEESNDECPEEDLSEGQAAAALPERLTIQSTPIGEPTIEDPSNIGESSVTESESTIPEIEMFYSARGYLSSSCSSNEIVISVQNSADDDQDSFTNGASLHSVDAARLAAAFSKSPSNGRVDRRASGQRLARGSFRLPSMEQVGRRELDMDVSSHRLTKGSLHRCRSLGNLREDDLRSTKPGRRASGQCLGRGSFHGKTSKGLLPPQPVDDDETEVDFYSAYFEETAVPAAFSMPQDLEKGERKLPFSHAADELVEEEKTPI